MVACVEKNKRSMKNKINHLLVDYNRTTSYLLDFIPQKIAEASLCRDLECLSVSNSRINPESLHEPLRFLLDQSNTEASLMDAEEEDCASLLSSDSDIIILETEEYEIPCSDDEDVVELLEESNCDFDDTFPVVEEHENEAELKGSDISNCIENFTELDSIVDDSLLNTSDFETCTNGDSVCPVSACETALSSKVPEWFLQKYRLGIITPNLTNVINFQRWFIPSQSEDYFSKPSHVISLPILQTVVGITLGENAAVTKVKCHARSKGIHLGVYDIKPVFEVHAQPLPSLLSVASLPVEVRASILVDCLGLPNNINLRIFPREWRLYMLVLMYWKNHCKQPAVNDSHIRAVIVCLIYLSVIDPKVGFARLVSDLKRMKKEKKRSDKLLIREISSLKVIGDALSVNTDQTANSSGVIEDSLPIDTDLHANSSKVMENPLPVTDQISVGRDLQMVDEVVPIINENISLVDGNSSLIDTGPTVAGEDSINELFENKTEYDSVKDFLDLISEEDCYKSAMALLNYHHVNPTLLKNRKDFDLKLIHSLAQLQHCIQSISILNSVLDFPFLQCQPHLCFSGTFLYNFYCELNHRKLADGYITRTILTKAGTIIALYRYLISSWEAVTSKKVLRPKFEVKKKKKKFGQPLIVQLSDEPTEPELFHDPDNIYSMLPEE